MYFYSGVLRFVIKIFPLSGYQMKTCSIRVSELALVCQFFRGNLKIFEGGDVNSEKSVIHCIVKIPT